jgi:hypothetical protein
MALACPAIASASSIVSFGFSNTGATSGTISCSAAVNNDPACGSSMTAVVSITLNDLTIGFNDYIGSITETYSNATGLLTFSGTITGQGLASNLSGTFFSAQVAKNEVSSFTLNALNLYTGVSSLTFSNAFLADLGLAGGAVAQSGSASITSSANMGNTGGNVTSSTATFSVSAVPEPSSLATFGLGLLLVAGLYKRRANLQE